MRILFKYDGEQICSEIVSANYDSNIFETGEHPIEGLLVYEMNQIYAIPMTFEKASRILQELCEKGFAIVLENVSSDLLTRWYNPETESFE